MEISMNDRRTGCPYCTSFLARDALSHASCKPFDRVLAETEHFVAVPTRGSLVEGWVLIVPKQHIFSMAQLSKPHLNELHAFISDIATRITDAWTIPPTIFEHGALQSGDLIGCGVNHAHLHLAPIRFSLERAIYLSHLNLDSPWAPLPPNSNIVPNSTSQRYMLYKEPNKQAMICYPHKQTSQYFRRVIANAIGLPEHYDYKSYDFIENVIKTTKKLHGTHLADTPLSVSRQISYV